MTKKDKVVTLAYDNKTGETVGFTKRGVQLHKNIKYKGKPRYIYVPKNVFDYSKSPAGSESVYSRKKMRKVS